LARLTLILAVVLFISAPAAADDLICRTCGGAIAGDFIEVGAYVYHPYHLKCTGCGEVINSEFYIHEGEPYHADCLAADESAYRCALCGEAIFDEREQDFWGNWYHRSHARKVGRCPYCGRYFSESVSKGKYQYQDGRYICGICRESAVLTTIAVDSLLEETGRRLADLGISLEPGNIPVTLISLDQLRGLPDADTASSGYTFCEELHAGDTERVDRQVCILFGLPRMRFVSVLAHELMHAWMFTNGCADWDPLLAEGSCNYTSYLVMGTYSAPEAEFEKKVLEEEEDAVYGAGFKRVLALAEERGTSGWLEWIGTERKFPEDD
jgi:hypothetical protein